MVYKWCVFVRTCWYCCTYGRLCSSGIIIITMFKINGDLKILMLFSHLNTLHIIPVQCCCLTGIEVVYGWPTTLSVCHPGPDIYSVTLRFLLKNVVVCWQCKGTNCISIGQYSYFIGGCWHFLPGFFTVCHSFSCTSFLCVGANLSFISKEPMCDSSEQAQSALRAAEACDMREITRSRTSGSLVSSTDLWISWR